jgi:hypothetical protein
LETWSTFVSSFDVLHVEPVWRCFSIVTGDGGQGTGFGFMGVPSVDPETLAAYFHPILPATWP